MPIFGIQERLGSIRVLMPGEAIPLGGHRNPSISWVYAPNATAAARLNLSSLFRVGRTDIVLWHGKAQISRADSFLLFAKERLKAYRGGFRSDFAAFLKEVAFRFNARTSPTAYTRLLDAMAL